MKAWKIAAWILLAVIVAYGLCLVARAIYVCRADPRKSRYGCPKCLPLVSEGFANKMYNLVDKYVAAMRQEGIDTWATAGTLLGIVRGIGHMPWDDDADFAIRKDSLPQFLQISWKKYGLKIMKMPHGYHVYENRLDGRWVDVFVYEPDPDNPDMWRFASARSRKMWPKETFSHKMLFPLRPSQFGTVSVLVPNDARGVAIQSYSADAIEHVRVKPMHTWTALDWPFTLSNGSFSLRQPEQRPSTTFP